MWVHPVKTLQSADLYQTRAHHKEQRLSTLDPQVCTAQERSPHMAGYNSRRTENPMSTRFACSIARIWLPNLRRVPSTARWLRDSQLFGDAARGVPHLQPHGCLHNVFD